MALQHIRPLEPEASQQVIENAIRTQSQVMIESPNLPGNSVNGFLLSGDQRAVLVEITGRPSLDRPGLMGTTCDVMIHETRQYQFGSSITGVLQWGETNAIALTRPETVRMVERRRFLRATLAPSSIVQLQWKEKGVTHRHTVPLLNISCEGLACRIEAEAIATVRSGDLVVAGFHLPWINRMFNLRSMVTNQTPASEGYVILGLQFDKEAHGGDQLIALKEGLRSGDRRPESSDRRAGSPVRTRDEEALPIGKLSC